MTGPEGIDVARDAITTFLVVCAPIMGVTLIVGLSIALLQALTQIQEMTIVFVPKIFVIFLMLIAMLPFMGSKLAELMTEMMTRAVGG